MLTKKQLEDARHCKHCSKCEMYKKKEKEGYLPIQKYCQKEAARAALAYREMLEKVTKALAEATEVISEQLDIVNEVDLALIIDASILLGESEGGGE